jgi:type II restriction/modification system DNA methylase subunit YeeA
MRRMTAADFIAKWGKAELKERSAAQEHFLDLCALFGHPTPAQADPTGESFCFEKDAAKHGGGDGFADVWKKGFFGWEYKGKHKDLTAAYDQLLLYRDALANPPLLVACDLDRIVVHTNFTNTVSARHEIPLKQLGEPRSQEILRAVFFQPDLLRPGRTSEAVTQEAAEQFAGIAEAMRLRGLPPAPVAHFLNRLVFCLFAEDIGLLPVQIFTRIVDKAGGEAEKFARFLGQLFEAMAKGGEFGLESIRHFNGNLFDDASVPPLVNEDIQRIAHTVRLDWSAVDPSIFGTLFERGLDPAKRSQLGAHYTSRVDIEKLVEPVVMDPLRQEWRDARDVAERLIATGQKKAGAAPAKPMSAAVAKKAKGEADSILHRFLMRLHAVRVLDPACGSGNFLYVTLQKLKDLEKEVILFAMQQGLGGYLPMVGPWQLHGIELNPYAHDLAQTAVWIGFLQWTRANGFQIMQTPILRTMTGNFQCRDSILNADGSEPEWPAVDFIVGNPPFLGDKMMRRELGDEYVDRLRTLFHGRLPGQSDLCCYWFEKARAQLAAGKCKRAGLLATQGIRGGANREVLKRIKESGDIFWAISDKDWALDGRQRPRQPDRFRCGPGDRAPPGWSVDIGH